MKKFLREAFQGLFWAALVGITLFVHYFVYTDMPEFRYVGY